MYIVKSMIDGMNILSFNKETIKTVSREKSLEEIFLSTLFLNYLIVLVVYLITLMLGGISINGREVNMPVFFGLLMVYPFMYNLLIYGIYGFFGLFAEMLDKKSQVKPIMSVGFHTAIVYSLIFYIIGMFVTFNAQLAMLLLGVFMFYFLASMFLSISVIYNFSLAQTLIVLFVPLLVISLVLLLVSIIAPSATTQIIQSLFV